VVHKPKEQEMPDGNYGKHQQGRSRILTYSFGAPALGTTTAVHAAVTDTGVQQVVTTGITNPDVARNVTATAGGTAGDIKAITVTVAGTNVFGEAISEVLPAFTVNTAGDVTGSKAFATVTSITIPAHDGLGATTSVGVGAKLGLPVTLPRKSFVGAWNDNAAETISASVVDDDEVEKNTVTMTTAHDGAKVFLLDYYR
jgi:hypothetical protein